MFRGLAQQPQAGAAQPLLDLEPLIHQVAELPVFEPLVDQYRLHRLVCPDCGATTCGVMPPGAPPAVSDRDCRETRTNRGLLFEIGTQIWNENPRKTFHR